MSNKNKLLQIKVQTNASSNRLVHGKKHDNEGNEIIQAYLTASPEKGKANKLLIKLLSKEYKVPVSSIKIIKGVTSKHKTIQING